MEYSSSELWGGLKIERKQLHSGGGCKRCNHKAVRILLAACAACGLMFCSPGIFAAEPKQESAQEIYQAGEGITITDMDSDASTISVNVGGGLKINDNGAVEIDLEGESNLKISGGGSLNLSTNLTGLDSVDVNGININGNGNTISGLANTTWNKTAKPSNPGMAATEGELWDVSQKFGDLFFENKETNVLDRNYANVATALTDLDAAFGTTVQYDSEDKSSMTLGGKDGTAIHNIADGKVSDTSMDAINGSQLHATNSQIGIETNEDGTTKFKDITVKDANGGAITNLTDAVNRVDDKVGSGKLSDGSANLTDAINNNYTSIQYQGQQLNALSDRVSDLGGEIDNVGAISAALAGLHPLDYDGTGSKFQLSAAMGSYDGSQAMAIGGFYHFNEDIMLSLGGATAFDGDHKTAANLGVTVRVGQGGSGHRDGSPDVQAKLDAQDAQIAEQNQRIAELTAKVEALMAKEGR